MAEDLRSFPRRPAGGRHSSRSLIVVVTSDRMRQVGFPEADSWPLIRSERQLLVAPNAGQANHPRRADRGTAPRRVHHVAVGRGPVRLRHHLDTDLAAALGRPPQPGPWTADVRDKVGAAVPGLLRGWVVEPPANQLALAALAAAFPERGQARRGQIAELTAGQAGTQTGAYGNLALLLLAGDVGGTLAARPRSHCVE